MTEKISSFSEIEKENFKSMAEDAMRDVIITGLRASDKSDEYYSSDVKRKQRPTEKNVEKLTKIAADIFTEIYCEFGKKGINPLENEIENKLLKYVEKVTHQIHNNEISKADAIKGYFDGRKN